MMTTFDAQTIDVCQCTKANGTRENEGEAGTTLICPDCHLEEATAREGTDAEQTAVEQAVIPDKTRIYAAFKDSPSLMRIASQNPGEQSIELVIRKRQKGQKPSARFARNLVKEYGTTALTTSLKSLLDEGVFTSPDIAKRRFPDLFLDEQLQESKEGREAMTELPVTTEVQPGNNECNIREDMTDNHDTVEVENSRNSQTIQDPCPLTSLPVRPQQRLMSQLQLMLEHACFEFGQREMQKELDKRGWTCAEAVPLQTWTVLFRQNETFETEENAFTLSYILNSVDNVQGLTIYRRVIDLDELRELLSHVEEFVQLLNTPAYWSAVKQLRQVIEDTLRRVNITATLFQKGADRKIAQIEEQRKRLKRQEDEAKQGLQESLNKLQNSIECEVFVAMRQAKEDLPDIGLA
ncbi:unnamed protein product [Fusarium langsethiae]|nr:unnamed protein product [Fusarium langsethiae]